MVVSTTSRILLGLSLIFMTASCSRQGEQNTDDPTAEPALSQQQNLASEQGDERPNILLIVADDMGYSDLGVFGSEIDTPNIDSLAQAGKIMSNFRVAPTCSPSRSMMLSGVDSHKAGLGSMNGMQSEEQKGQPGYEGFLNKNVVTFVNVLKGSGYHTYMAGKWQQGYEPGLYPLDRGFERAFWLKNGGASHYSDMNGIASTQQRASWFEDELAIEQLPENFYTSEYFTDKLIEYVDSSKGDGVPFFLFAAYTAPHWPLHAPQEYMDKYQDVYDVGYDVIRNQRIERMRELGLMAPDQQAASQHPEWPAWEELDDDQKRHESKRMQTYAAMVDALDDNIGRLVDYLQDIGEYDNTLIMFFSDNGATGNNPRDLSKDSQWLPATFDNSYENIGKPGSYVSTGPGWAHVSNTPHHMYKGFPTEGGIASPMFSVFPKRIAAGGKSAAFATVLDIAPTLLDAAEATHPAPEFQGRQVLPMQGGTSLIPHLTGVEAAVHEQDHVYALELFNRRMIRQADWKMLWINKPWGKDGWALYNLKKDAAEQNDLSETEPEQMQHMLSLWNDYTAENNVLVFPDFDMGYSNKKSHYQDHLN